MAESSGKTPAKVRPRFSSVHEHFDKVTVTQTVKGKTKTSEGSNCKHCGFTLSNRVSTNARLILSTI